MQISSQQAFVTKAIVDNDLPARWIIWQIRGGNPVHPDSLERVVNAQRERCCRDRAPHHR